MLDLLAQSMLSPDVNVPEGTTWLPFPGSTAAPHTDFAFYFIYWISVFFFILIVGLMAWFVLRYRARTAGAKATVHATHNNALEITWTAIPLVLVVVMFYLGFRGFMDMMNPPANALDIYVQGEKWNWSFTYPSGHQDNELHVPVHQPVRLILSSKDVIHSFYVPEFRIKRDAVPGRYNKIWFEANRAGDYVALCAEYCGTSHSDMVARVVVHPPGEYETWLAEAAKLAGRYPLWKIGEVTYTKRCRSCHTHDGTAGTGPTFKGLWLRKEQVRTDKGEQLEIVADENYIRDSINYPNRMIVAGFQPQMSTFKGQLKEYEYLGLIEYIKQLSGVTVSEDVYYEPGQAPAGAASQPATAPTTAPAPGRPPPAGG